MYLVSILLLRYLKTKGLLCISIICFFSEVFEIISNILSAKQIRDGWLKHIKPEEENYLWVSNQKAFDLMKDGVLPPETANPNLNEHFEMIDAQLTTEIFGLFAPTRPDVALKIAHLPIQTTARREAEDISKFYVTMYSLASITDNEKTLNQRISWMSDKAREVLPNSSYSAQMFDYTRKLHKSGIAWEQARDSIYYRYQVNQEDGYDITSKKLYCNGCFAAGINFAASLVSLFYGEGDLKETIKIGTLAGWDSDNPTATWGGLLGFMIGKNEIEKVFDKEFAVEFNIHRTRKGFPNNGIDTFEKMAKKGIAIVDRVVESKMSGRVDLKKNIELEYKSRVDLLNEEGLCMGGSTGINIAGAIRMAQEMGPGHTIVTILCDVGNRYQSKLYNPTFLEAKGLPVPTWLANAPRTIPAAFE